MCNYILARLPLCELNMYGRAPRVTFMTAGGASSAVGPGSYNVSQSSYKISGTRKNICPPKIIFFLLQKTVKL